MSHPGHPGSHPQRRRAGFTLLELLIALCVASILAMLAAPSFQQQLRKARRADGQTALLGLAMAQERFRGSCPQYAGKIRGARGCVPGAPSESSLGLSDLSTEGHYRLSFQRATSLAFEAQAHPIGDQSADRASGIACDPLTLDQDGHRAPPSCW